jgi:hypothetical protein
MLCEAVLEIRDRAGQRLGGRPGEGLAESILVELAVRPAIRGGLFSHKEFATKKANPSSKRM